MLRLTLMVAAGSAAGGALRYLTSAWMLGRAWGGLPAATLLVNVVGSLALGVLARVALESPSMTPEARALLGAGLCGGLTTFSTFALETVVLMQKGEWGRAAIYIAASVALSLAALAAGMVLGRELLAMRR